MKKRAGFTLVELVVVVMILGILAAVAAPKFLSQTNYANEGNIKQSLDIIRNTIDSLTAQANGKLPLEDAVSQTGDDFITLLKPHLRGQKFPLSPVATDATLNVNVLASKGATDVDNSSDWIYYLDDGSFIVNSDKTDANGDEYSTY